MCKTLEFCYCNMQMLPQVFVSCSHVRSLVSSGTIKTGSVLVDQDYELDALVDEGRAMPGREFLMFEYHEHHAYATIPNSDV